MIRMRVMPKVEPTALSNLLPRKKGKNVSVRRPTKKLRKR
jgi:hypothetical protein